MRSNSARSPASCFRPAAVNLVVPGSPIGLGEAPFRFCPAVQQQPLEGRIQRALADVQHVSGRHPEVLDDRVAVLRP